MRISVYASTVGLILVMAALVTFPLAQAQGQDFTYIEFKPSDMRWVESTRVVGMKNAALLGDSNKPGLFVYRTLFPAGFKVPPHAHLENRTVTVISGTLYVGNGEVFDETKIRALPAGSFYTEPDGLNHFVWAKDGDVVIQVQGMGPARVKFVESPNQPPQPRR
jgi:quercetin dioxygenase-like cupin family protein